MFGVPSITRAVLPQHQAVLVISLVLLGVIVALFTLGTRERNKDAICFPGHRCLSWVIPWLKLAMNQRFGNGAHGEDRTHDLTLTKGVLYH